MNVSLWTATLNTAKSPSRQDSAAMGLSSGPSIGSILADLAINGHTESPCGFLGLDRLEW